MRTFNDTFISYAADVSSQPRITIAIHFDDTDTDVLYLTSHDETQRPSTNQSVDCCIKSFSGGTQKLDPRNFSATIGSISWTAVNVDKEITAILSQKDSENKSPRHKKVEIYLGYGSKVGSQSDFDWLRFESKFTMILRDYSVERELINFVANDVQRLENKDLFVRDKTTLRESITSDQLIIPISVVANTTRFQTVEHDASYSDRPNEAVGYVEINDEVISHSGVIADPVFGVSFNGLERGALNTSAVAHNVDANQSDDKKTPVNEFIYLEGAALKVLYALQTGILYGQNGATLPDSWHHGIDPRFVRVDDYLNVDPLLWEPSQNTGRKLRFEGLKKVNGQRFIESEILAWLGGIRPIYSDGAIGFKKLSSVISESSYIYELNNDNVVSFGSLGHRFQDVVNDITILWNYDFRSKEYRQTSRVIDTSSKVKYQDGSPKSLKFQGVKTGTHTDQDIRTVFDSYRNRYAGGGYTFSAELMPNVNQLEVGDIVRITTDQITDPLTGQDLDRVFEVQQVSPNFETGRMSVSLFASTERAGEFEEISGSTVLDDEFYTSSGVNIATLNGYVNGTLTQDITLNGGDTLSDGIFYHDGNLTIAAGVTVTIQDNVQLRVKGVFTRNGNINGVGTGKNGGSGANNFTNTTLNYLNTGNRIKWNGNPRTTPGVVFGSLDRFATNEQLGAPGYLGNSRPTDWLFGQAVNQGNAIYDPSNSTQYVFWDRIVSSDYAIVQGLNAEAPRISLINRDGSGVEGIDNLDLRGTSGSGSRPFITGGSLQTGIDDDFQADIFEDGKDGADSGAGLVIIARGEAVGSNSQIDLSAGDSGYTGYYNRVDSLPDDTEVSHAGSGGAAPGAYYLLIDGNGSFGSSTANITQNLSNNGVPANGQQLPITAGSNSNGAVTGDHYYYFPNGREWQPIDYPFGHPPRRLTFQEDYGVDGFKIQYIPPKNTLSGGTFVGRLSALDAVNSVEITSGGGTLLVTPEGIIRARALVEWDVDYQQGQRGYEVQARSVDANEDWRTIAFAEDLDSSSAYFDVNDGETYDVRIRVLSDSTAQNSAWATQFGHVAVGKNSSKPSAPFLSGNVVDNNVLLTYRSQILPDQARLARYEIFCGDNFNIAISKGDKSANSSFTTLFEPFAGEFKYWITAVDIFGNISDPSSITLKVDQPPDFVAVADPFDERDLGFPGIVSSIAIDSDGSALAPVDTQETWQDHFTNNNWMNFEDAINDGYIPYFSPNPAQAEYNRVIDLGSVLPIANYSLKLVIDQIFGNVGYDLTLSYGETIADISSNILPVGQSSFQAANFRYVRVNIIFSNPDQNSLARIVSIQSVIDAKIKTDQGRVQAQASDAGGTIVNFNYGFLDISSIIATPFTTSDYNVIVDFVDSPNPTSFKLLVFDNTGARVSSEISWQARGI